MGNMKLSHGRYLRSIIANCSIPYFIGQGESAMKDFISNQLQTKVQGVRKNPRFQTCKMIYLCFFGAGFVIALLLGKDFLDKAGILNVNALKEVRNTSFDKKDFLQYIFRQRILLLAIGAVLWWWNLGKLYVYGILGWAGFSMGICMYTCLLRYALKGIFLWFFMYFPQVLFYTTAMICGMILSSGVHRDKAEKIKFLFQNGLLVLLLIVFCGLGIYTEGTWNAAMLKDFLQYF